MMEPFQTFTSHNDVQLYIVPQWMQQDEQLTVGFTSRSGGVSQHPWQSLNVGLHVGDVDADVVHNRQRIAEAMGWDFEAWTCAEQVHGHRVVKVTSADRGKGRLSRHDVVADCDALMTDERDILLVSFYADCVPLYFYDPFKKVVALAHAGWKGTVQQIAKHTVQAMQEQYGCVPSDLRAAIGPSIGACCYEVDQYVLNHIYPLLEQLRQTQPQEQNNIDAIVDNKNSEKAHLNLQQLNRQIMLQAGILPNHLEMTTLCTGCRTDQFFSHRHEGGHTGRMASWIGLSKGE